MLLPRGWSDQLLRGSAFKVRPEESNGHLNKSEEEENSKQRDHPSEGSESEKSELVPGSSRRERPAGVWCSREGGVTCDRRMGEECREVHQSSFWLQRGE